MIKQFVWLCIRCITTDVINVDPIWALNISIEVVIIINEESCYR